MFTCVWTLLALSSVCNVAAWDYRVNGADWRQGSCGAGGPQSPVNLPASAPDVEHNITMFLKYPKLDSHLKVYHNGKSIAFTLPESFKAGFGIGKGEDGTESFKSEDGKAYRLWQVNFHSPSEHTIDGQRMPLEMQLMHQQVTGGDGLAVIVVLFQLAPNAYGALLDGVIGRGLPNRPWQEAVRDPPFELAPVLGGSPYFVYDGSLTVPPCEQQVKYFVRKEPVLAAHAQLQQFSKVLKETTGPKGNYRGLQSLSGQYGFIPSIDLVGNPTKVVKNPKSKLAADKVDQLTEAEQSGGAAMAGLSACFDSHFKNMARIKVGETKDFVKAKEDFNFAKRNLQVGQNSIASIDRQLKNTQRMYDAAPGPVEQIGIKWQLTGQDGMLKSAEKALPDLEHEEHDKLQVLVGVVIAECKKRAAEEKKKKAADATAQSADAALKEEKATRHFDYPEPRVKLPRGLGASPFSKKELDPASKVVLAARIASNLQQPDLPSSDIVDEAKGKSSSPKVGRNPDVMLGLNLPIGRKIAEDPVFSEDIVNALAKASQIPKSRLMIKEIRDATVPKVHSTGTAFSLTQEDSAELPHRNLRRGLPS